MELLQTVAKDYGLFVALTAYILWFFDKLLKQNRSDNAERETRYMGVIDKLSDSFSALTKDVEEIKTMLQLNHEEEKTDRKKVVR